ncbi:SIS domain-containing protein [Thermophilibacter sp.]
MSAESMKDVVRAEGEELCKLADALDYEALGRFEDLVRAGEGAVFFTGCGTSAMAARKCVHTFQVIGCRAFYLNPSDAVHGGLGAVEKGDVVVVISKGGTTKELMSFLPNLREKGAVIVAVGERPDSPIGAAADLFVRVKVDREPDTFNMLATASTLAVISAFDGVAISLMRDTGFSKAAFLVNHPSGDVGDRLATGRA